MESSRARDIRRKSIYLWFDLREDAGRRFSKFDEALRSLTECQAVWRVAAREATGDWKHHAGAGSLVTRHRVSLERRLPPYFNSNVHPYALSLGTQTLYFFPGQILVYEFRRAGAVTYDSLNIQVDYCEYRETEEVPGDAEVIGHTWQYVNKKGGPDRRFSDNPQIPICRYEEIALRSATGLNIRLMLSRLGLGDVLRDAEAELVPLRREAATNNGSDADRDELAFQAWIRAQRSQRTRN